MAGTDRILDPQTKDYVLDTTTNSYETSRNARSAVYHSLVGYRGQWAADPEYGSRLHTLQRGKNSLRTPAVIRDMITEALQELIDDGRVGEPVITTERGINRTVTEVTIEDLQSGETIDITSLIPFIA